jgi:hypothetical protein
MKPPTDAVGADPGNSIFGTSEVVRKTKNKMIGPAKPAQNVRAWGISKMVQKCSGNHRWYLYPESDNGKTCQNTARVIYAGGMDDYPKRLLENLVSLIVVSNTSY